MGPKLVRHPARALGIDRSRVSASSLDVVRTLQSAGYDGYLVGGCVRDLLLGMKPKDFDVSTNATPEEVKDLFSHRRARIIGRRFRIVHVRCGREIIEVSTYRTQPNPALKSGKWRSRIGTRHSGRVLDDNVYGTIYQDVMRRDFTMNALYYDPLNECVLDFLNGIADVRSGVLQVIGNAERRFREDPVRVLRVARFTAKLGVRISADTKSEIDSSVPLLNEVPSARLYDEVLKLFHSGHAMQSWEVLKGFGILDGLFPEIMAGLHGAPNQRYEELVMKALNNTDRRIGEGKPVIPAFLFSVLFWPLYKTRKSTLINQGMHSNEASWIAGEAVLSPSGKTISIPARVIHLVIEIWAMQERLECRKPRTIERLLVDRRFRAAYDFLILRQQIGEVDSSIGHWWTKIQECDHAERKQSILALSQSCMRPKAGRRISRRKNRKTTLPKPTDPQRLTGV